jgi:hypothetical protein
MKAKDLAKLPTQGRVTVYNPTSKPVSVILRSQRVRIGADAAALVAAKLLPELFERFPDLTLDPTERAAQAAYGNADIEAAKALPEALGKTFLEALMRGERPAVPSVTAPPKTPPGKETAPKNT